MRSEGLFRDGESEFVAVRAANAVIDEHGSRALPVRSSGAGTPLARDSLSTDSPALTNAFERPLPSDRRVRTTDTKRDELANRIVEVVRRPLETAAALTFPGELEIVAVAVGND